MVNIYTWVGVSLGKSMYILRFVAAQGHEEGVQSAPVLYRFWAVLKVYQWIFCTKVVHIVSARIFLVQTVTCKVGGGLLFAHGWWCWLDCRGY